MNRFILITLAVAALVLGSQFVKACNPNDYDSDCYGSAPYGLSYDTYDRPSDYYSNDRPRDTLDIMLENQDRQQRMQAQSDRQLQNLYEEGRQQAIMRELRQINESLSR